MKEVKELSMLEKALIDQEKKRQEYLNSPEGIAATAYKAKIHNATMMCAQQFEGFTITEVKGVLTDLNTLLCTKQVIDLASLGLRSANEESHHSS